MNQIKDKALAVVAFAAFYRLESGAVVTSLVASDGTGIKPMREYHRTGQSWPSR